MSQEYIGSSVDGTKDVSFFKPTQPREKWLKRRTTIKLRVSTVQIVLCIMYMFFINFPVFCAVSFKTYLPVAVLYIHIHIICFTYFSSCIVHWAVSTHNSTLMC